MSMESKESIIPKLKLYRWFYIFTVFLFFALSVFYAAYSYLYTPERRMLLLTHVDSVYRNEDLTQSNTSEGELKQFVYDVLKKTFTYNFLSFADQVTYDKLLKKELYTDLPDHRDFLRPLFNEEAHREVIKNLKDAPWMFRFIEERRRLIFSMTLPPTTRGAQDASAVVDGRLTRDFNGHFFLISQGFNRKTARYKINYQIVMERRPNATLQEANDYFFRPMVPDNNFEWRVKQFSWTTEKVN